jgi:hypothetical protein
MPEYKRRLPHFQPNEVYLFPMAFVGLAAGEGGSLYASHSRTRVRNSRPRVGPPQFRTFVAQRHPDRRTGFLNDSGGTFREALLRSLRLSGDAEPCTLAGFFDESPSAVLGPALVGRLKSAPPKPSWLDRSSGFKCRSSKTLTCVRGSERLCHMIDGLYQCLDVAVAIGERL